MWDASALLEGDPDEPGELFVRLLITPDFPLPLAMVECAANLEVTIKVTRLKSDFPDLTCYELCFTGKCLDLSEVDMRLGEWQIRHGLPNKSEQELLEDRAAFRND